MSPDTQLSIVVAIVGTLLSAFLGCLQLFPKLPRWVRWAALFGCGVSLLISVGFVVSLLFSKGAVHPTPDSGDNITSYGQSGGFTGKQEAQSIVNH